MMPTGKPGPAIVNVVPGQNATASFVIGPTYRAIYLSGTVKNTTVPPSLGDIFADITILRDGNPARVCSALQLDSLNSLDLEKLRSNIYGATGQIVGSLTVPTVAAGTSASFAVGDTLTYTGGTIAPGGQAAKFVVTGAGALSAASLRVVNPGQYSIAPTSTVPLIVSSAAGAVGTATFTGVFSVLTCLAPNGLGLVGSAAYGAITPAIGDTCTFVIGIFFDDLSRSSNVTGAKFAWPTKWPKPAVANPNLNTNGDGTQSLPSLEIQIAVPLNGASGASTCSGHAISCTIETTDDLGTLVDANGILQGNPGFQASTSTPFTGIIQWKRNNVPYTAAGDLPLSKLPLAVYQQLSFFSNPGDNITNLTVVVDGITRRNLTKNMNDELLCKRGMNELGLDPNRFDFVCDYTDNPLDALDVRAAGEFIVTPTLANANAASKTLVQIAKVYASME
jgi:hypothetical protein